MPSSNQFDVRTLSDLDLAFDKRSKEWSTVPRLVDGKNLWIIGDGEGAKIRKRPAIRDGDIGGVTLPTCTYNSSKDKRIDNIFLYQTTESPPKKYIMASMFDENDDSWQAYWLRPGASVPVWTSVGTTRDINRSRQSHEFVTGNGLCYIKSLTGADKNLILRSETFDNGGWVKSNVTITPDSTVAPDSNTTADTAADSSGAATGFLLQNITGLSPSSSWYTASIYIKKDSDETRFPNFLFKTTDSGSVTNVIQQVQVNTQTGVIILTNVAFTAKVVSVDSNWWRLIIPIQDDNTNTDRIQLLIQPAFSTTLGGSAVVSLTDSIIIWGAQVVKGSSALPYQVTTSAAVVDGDLLGSTVFNGVDASTTIWGHLAPTIPSVLTSSGGWGASNASTTINVGWKYTYTYKLLSGHHTSRAALTTPTGVGVLSASDTGTAATNKKPEMTVTGVADTTNVPTIQAWRTTDGGGTFLSVGSLANPGATTATYTDDDRDPANPGDDPKTDFQLNPFDFAPTEISNDPPPTVAFDGSAVTGTDEPQAFTPIVEFAGRLWYGIGNQVFFSSNEEVINGVPQESFKSGLNGARIRFKTQVRNLASTNEALYIFTQDNVFWVRGFNRDSFQVKPLLAGVGSLYGQPRAVDSVRGTILFITEDYELAVIEGTTFRVLSFPLAGEITDAITSTSQLIVQGYAWEGNFWAVVGLHDPDTPGNGRVWVYDFVREKWNLPWHVPVTALMSGKIDESTSKNILMVATDDATGPRIGLFDEDQQADELATGDAGFAIQATTNTFEIPAGNHVNLLRVGGHHPEVAYLQTTRTKFSSDTDVTVKYRLNEISGSLTTVTKTDPPYQAASTTIDIGWYPIKKVGQRVSMDLSKTLDTEKFELQEIGFVWQPEAGT